MTGISHSHYARRRLGTSLRLGNRFVKKGNGFIDIRVGFI